MSAARFSEGNSMSVRAEPCAVEGCAHPVGYEVAVTFSAPDRLIDGVRVVIGVCALHGPLVTEGFFKCEPAGSAKGATA